jgi:hypothetical protein
MQTDAHHCAVTRTPRTDLHGPYALIRVRLNYSMLRIGQSEYTAAGIDFATFPW